MDVRSLHGKTALVTGAGSGIGRATALAFARRGADLALCDVDEAGLADVEKSARALGRDVLAWLVDVSDAEAMRAFADAVHERVPAVDLLMNNAGVALAGGTLHTSLDDWRWIVGVNLWGVIHGCHFFVPKMVERGAGGHVINVASMASYTASEALAAYNTTKFAVRGLSESLDDEVRRFGIHVTCVCPGLISTALPGRTRMRGPAADVPGARERMLELVSRRGYTPERVAENVLKAVQRDRVVAPIAPEAWIFFYAKRFFPGLVRAVTRWGGGRSRRELGVE